VYRDKDGQEHQKSQYPPMDVIRDMDAKPIPPRLPVLDRVVEIPGFDSQGNLLWQIGYHASNHSFHYPAPGLRVPPVSECPTPEELAEARELMEGDLLGEFPFEGPSDRAHAMAALLLPFARDLVIGPTPLHLIEKPGPGTGATLLAQVLTLPSCGTRIAAMTEGRDEEEWRRRIFGKLLSGSEVVLIDNVREKLESAALASAITAEYYEDRRIRTSDVIRVPVRCMWMVTANNPVLAQDLIRRSVRIRLDARTEQPWLRTGFRHPQLLQWAKEQRARLVWAALTLIQSWIAAGRVPGKAPLGMFESWAAVMGGIFDHVGVPGFLGNLDTFYESEDPESANWTGFAEAWFEMLGDAETAATSLVKVAYGAGVIDSEDEGKKIVLGRLLSQMRDRQFNGLRIVRVGSRKGTQIWKVIRVEGS
jgi:hypothetical protein